MKGTYSVIIILLVVIVVLSFGFYNISSERDKGVNEGPLPTIEGLSLSECEELFDFPSDNSRTCVIELDQEWSDECIFCNELLKGDCESREGKWISGPGMTNLVHGYCSEKYSDGGMACYNQDDCIGGCRISDEVLNNYEYDEAIPDEVLGTCEDFVSGIGSFFDTYQGKRRIVSVLN
jgi:hypothetical protein